MRLYYNGVDITNKVHVLKCTCQESSGDNCDSVDIELENAYGWYSWRPQVDDVLVVSESAYQTGKMYLAEIYPYDGRYRIIATSIPRLARRKSHAVYDGMRVREILASCAAECGTESKMHGTDGDAPVRFITRKYESPCAFANGLCKLEGLAFKTTGGRLWGIDIRAVQAADAAHTLRIDAGRQGVTHLRRDEEKWSSLTIKTPWCSCAAVDRGALEGNDVVLTHLPADDDAQAGRWARGLLLSHNRGCETLRIATGFNSDFQAMMRLDIISDTEISGRWIVDEAEHDLIRRKSTATLVRCINTIE